MALPRSILLAVTGTALLLGTQACTKPAAQVDMQATARMPMPSPASG